MLAGLPESTEWRDSLILNLALQAEFTLKCAATVLVVLHEHRTTESLFPQSNIAVRACPLTRYNLSPNRLGTGKGGAAVYVELRTFAAVDGADGERSYPNLTFAPAEGANPTLALTDSDGFTVTLSAAQNCPIAGLQGP